MKTKIQSKWLSKLFIVLVAATLIALMIPHGAQAKVVKGEANASHGWIISNDDDPDAIRPEGFKSWNVTVKMDNEVISPKHEETANPLSSAYFPGTDIPDGARIGIDQTDYSLHIQSEENGHLYDTYVEAVPKDENKYEAYAWYVENSTGTFRGLEDLVDASIEYNTGLLVDSTWPSTINFFAEFIGKVNYKLTGGEGHARFDMQYYINQHEKADYTYSKESLSSYAWEGTKVNISTTGEIECINYDEYNDYFECGHIVAVPKDGYKFKSWTVNGEEFPVGKELKDLPITFPHDTVVAVANYEPMNIAQTGDNNAIVFIVIGLIVAAGVCGAFAARKIIKK